MRKLLLFVCFVSYQAYADPAVIDVLVVYTPDAANEIDTNGPGGLINTETHADANIGGMNQVLKDSGLDDNATFRNAGVYEMDDFDEDDWINHTPNADVPRHNRTISTEINTNPGNHTAGGTTIEDLMTQTGADIVIVVGHNTSASGAVEENLEDIDGDSGNYTATVDVAKTGGLIWMHEVGHLGGIWHNGDLSNTTDISGDAGYKGNDNHGDYGTIMTSPSAGQDYCKEPICSRLPVFSDKDRTTPVEDSQGRDRGPPLGGGLADAVGVLEQTLPNIGDYAGERHPGPLPTPVITTGFMYCTGPTGTYSLTGTLPGYTVIDSHYEYKKGSQPWSDVYEGPLTCPTTTSIGSFRVRVTLTTPQGDTEDEQWVIGYPCEPGW